MEATGLIREDCTVPWEHLRLPPFSQVALRVLQLVHRENVQLHELSDLIASDPAFASEVLAIVNSLAYAPRFPISSILQAIAVMGASHLQGLCLTVGVRGYMGQSLGNPSVRAVWRHNLACAAIAEQLAAAGFIDRDTAYTFGMMHDVGRVALASVRPREYARLLSTHRGSAESILDREREAFGKDHCEVGRELVKDWKLPEDFEAIVAEHHQPADGGGTWDMDALIRLSCRMADSAGFAAFPACECAAFGDLLGELPARERKLFFTDAESLAYEVGRKINAIESI